MKPLPIFIGYDNVESLAWHVAAHSIRESTRSPVAITPIDLRQLPLTRERDPKQSNEFAFSRFLVPWLCDYDNWALWMDCDVLLRADVQELFDLADDRYAVQVVKHDYTPSTERKYLGNRQHPYPRKNWSSVILFNCAKCQTLTPAYVDTAEGLTLHRFLWLPDAQIGELPAEWNHLVSEYDPNPGAKLVHYTIGGPWWPEFDGCEFSTEWHDACHRMMHVK